MVENPYDAPALDAERPEAERSRPAEPIGKVIAICVIAFAIGTSLAAIVAAITASGPQALPWQIVRLALVAGISHRLYRGRSWARYVMAAFFALGAIVSLASFPAMIAQSPPTSWVAYITVLTVGYSAAAVGLLAVPSVGRFAERQRGRDDGI